jgi:hypothetical protein
MDHAAPDVVRVPPLITLYLNDDEVSILIAALGRAWAGSLRDGHHTLAEDFISLQTLIWDQRQTTYEKCKS